MTSGFYLTLDLPGTRINPNIHLGPNRPACERKSIMSRIVAFQGERGANSEDAVVKFFGEVQVLPCRTLHDVFAAVENGAATDGLIPIENSQAGSINDSYDLLLKHPLNITGEVNLQVNHCLQSLPGESLETIKQVYSHPQALAQCEEFLRELGAEKIAVYDTAGSAKMLREKEMRGCAAIASRRAAVIYGLEILAEGIQTNPENYTRFYAISKHDGPKGERNKISLVLATQHRPGCLYWCLGALAYRQINLTKLESRPSRNRPWEYIFYLDIEGHITDEACQEAIAELKTKTTMLRVLGSYPAAQE